MEIEYIREERMQQTIMKMFKVNYKDTRMMYTHLMNSDFFFGMNQIMKN